ncbi:helix-turn-helix domain-containing protein [Rufibacter immobilis]|uniref:helix-turn-helix domain-containing protein n=1 Tax=Rufibacter immobilis TaxID=1348778 RepID=UPI0035E5DD61
MPEQFLFQMKAQEAIEAIAQRVVELIRTAQPEEGQQENSSEVPISTAEACAVLRISRPTMSSWKSKGLVPFHRKGRRVYFFKSELLASLESSKQTIGGRVR